MQPAFALSLWSLQRACRAVVPRPFRAPAHRLLPLSDRSGSPGARWSGKLALLPIVSWGGLEIQKDPTLGWRGSKPCKRWPLFPGSVPPKFHYSLYPGALPEEGRTCQRHRQVPALWCSGLEFISKAASFTERERVLRVQCLRTMR